MTSIFGLEFSYFSNMCLGDKNFCQTEPPFHQELAQNDNVIQTAQGPVGYNRSCWPDNCGPGRGPWQDRQAALPPGVTTRRFKASTKCSNFFFLGVQKYPLFTKSLQKHRQEYVVIPYTFYDGTDDTRKNAFRVAVQRWHANTCVALVEQNQADITRPYIKAEFCGGWVICKKLNLDQTVVERGFVGHEIPS